MGCYPKRKKNLLWNCELWKSDSCLKTTVAKADSAQKPTHDVLRQQAVQGVWTRWFWQGCKTEYVGWMELNNFTKKPDAFWHLPSFWYFDKTMGKGIAERWRWKDHLSCCAHCRAFKIKGKTVDSFCHNVKGQVWCAARLCFVFRPRTTLWSSQTNND